MRKDILIFGLIMLSILLGACATGSIQTEQTSATHVFQATFTMPRSVVTSTATPTASPIPIFTVDPSAYDPDIYPPGVVEHQPPLIARSDETVTLAFWVFDTIYCEKLQRYCQMQPLLYYTYGDHGSFQSVPLIKEAVEELEQWVTRLPATDGTGKSLRYYAEFAFPEAGYTQRYPTAGTIDLFTTRNFLPVELPAKKEVEPGDKVYTFYWGDGPNTVHLALQGHIRIGPPAFDVASDGRIAFLNPVDDRVLIYDPREETYSSFSVPLDVYPDQVDLAFDEDDQLMICDFQGKTIGQIPRGVPYCYCLLPDGTIGASMPAYANFPIKLTEDLKLLDLYDYKLVSPFDAQGEVNPRETQRQKQSWDLPSVGLDWNKLRFADTSTGVAFEVHSDAHIGAQDFEKTPQGYLMILSTVAEQIRAIWIDPTGRVLKDVILPNSAYSMLSYGDIAVAQDGSLYVMSSTKNGIEIHFETAPKP